MSIPPPRRASASAAPQLVDANDGFRRDGVRTSAKTPQVCAENGGLLSETRDFFPKTGVKSEIEGERDLRGRGEVPHLPNDSIRDPGRANACRRR